MDQLDLMSYTTRCCIITRLKRRLNEEVAGPGPRSISVDNGHGGSRYGQEILLLLSAIVS